MTEKGIVQDIRDGKIQLKLESPQTQDQTFLPFEFKCDEKLVKGENITILLSPPHSIRAKPWELLVAMGLFFMGWICGYKLVGFLLAVGFLLSLFFTVKPSISNFKVCIQKPFKV